MYILYIQLFLSHKKLVELVISLVKVVCIAAGKPKKSVLPESFIFYVKAKIWFEKEIKNAYRVKHRGG